NPLEQQLVEIWAQVLQLAPEKIGINDNFFEIGGHSLLATQLVSSIRQNLSLEVSLKTLFEQSTISQLAQSASESSRQEVPPIIPIDRSRAEGLPLSFAQERLWFINQLQPGSANYNLPEVVRITVDIEPEIIEKIINTIIARHENIRSIFPSEKGTARLKILKELKVNLNAIDLSHIKDDVEKHKQAKRHCQIETTKAFNLEVGPLIRTTLIKLAKGDHILIINMHHIINDGWSQSILVKEIDLLLKNDSLNLPNLPVQYVDFSAWQRQLLQQDGIFEKQLDYWKEKLSGAVESLEFKTDFARPKSPVFVGSTEAFKIDRSLTLKLKRLAEQHNCTLYMVLLAIYKTLVNHLTKKEDICIGSPIASRHHREIENLIGLFVNNLALRTKISGNASFTENLQKVKETCLGAFEHQDIPFDKVVNLVVPKRAISFNPLYQIMLVLHNIPYEYGANIKPYPIDRNSSALDQVVEFRETESGLEGIIEYSTALYRPKTVRNITRCFIELSQAIVNNPGLKNSELNLFLGTSKSEDSFLQQKTNSRTNNQQYDKSELISAAFGDEFEEGAL
ncbi:MAG: condensation domain-containing protein, partial [Kangiellaceae bacterium]|nr:condensation domain-containing protein [Kangiellaceae bacterium]